MTSPVLRQVLILAAMALVALVVMRWGVAPEDQPITEGPPPAQQGDDVPDCAVEDLRATTSEVIDDIEVGGPFDYPRNDGGTFGNYEGELPQESRGYYREYTVQTPGASNRGARRIVTGGGPADDPEHWYYTADHYESFCEFAPAS